MNRDLTELEIQNIVRTAETIHQIKEKIELRKQLVNSEIEWYRKDKDLSPDEHIRQAKVDAFQYFYIDKKIYIAGA
jgi:hypothetical protein